MRTYVLTAVGDDLITRAIVTFVAEDWASAELIAARLRHTIPHVLSFDAPLRGVSLAELP